MLGTMTIDIYKTSADNRALDKLSSAQLVGAAITTIDIPRDNDILNPTFIIATNTAAYTANYLYCATYGRYYFIKSVVAMTGGRMAIRCYVDVLQTYADNIKNCYATITRTNSAPTKYVDTKLPVYPNKNNITSIIRTTTELNSAYLDGEGDYYLLTVVGGTATI